MKKLCYLLSIAGHTLLWLIALGADFPIVIIPEPARVVTVEISTPPPFLATAPFTTTEPAPYQPGQPGGKNGGGGENNAEAAGIRIAGIAAKHAPGTLFQQPGKFTIKPSVPGTFSLSPARKGPGLPAAFSRPGGAPRLGRYAATAYDPGLMLAGAAAPSGVVLIPFDAREKTVAAWTETVLTRIERNWLIPLSVRLALSGQVQITLTIEKNGSRQSLVLQDSSLPESLTQPALQAITASLPLPPLPENVAGQTFAFTFIFDYNG